MERYRLYELAEDKIKEDTKSHRCHFEDCWKTAIPLTDFCLFHIKNQKNQFVYQTEDSGPESEAEEPNTSHCYEITEKTEETKKEEIENKKRKWKEISKEIDFRQNYRQKIIRMAPQRNGKKTFRFHFSDFLFWISCFINIMEIYFLFANSLFKISFFDLLF